MMRSQCRQYGEKHPALSRTGETFIAQEDAIGVSFFV